jgi:hypothetical protein
MFVFQANPDLLPYGSRVNLFGVLEEGLRLGFSINIVGFICFLGTNGNPITERTTTTRSWGKNQPPAMKNHSTLPNNLITLRKKDHNMI